MIDFKAIPVIVLFAALYLNTPALANRTDVYRSKDGRTKLYLIRQVDREGNYQLKLCINNSCANRYKWIESGDGATIFGRNYNYTVYPDVSGVCSSCWFVEELNKETNTFTGWKATLR